MELFKVFNFSDKIPGFSKSIEFFKNLFCMGFCISIIYYYQIIKKKSVRKTQFYINHVRHLKKKSLTTFSVFREEGHFKGKTLIGGFTSFKLAQHKIFRYCNFLVTIILIFNIFFVTTFFQIKKVLIGVSPLLSKHYLWNIFVVEESERLRSKLVY